MIHLKYAQLLALTLACFCSSGRGQVVQVTALLDTNRVAVGQTTRLHVYAQIVPAQRSQADQIFSWYLDLAGSGVASLSPEGLLKPTSDNDPRTSSSGASAGQNVRGIFDTFINLPKAGRDAPVELFSVPVSGASPGQAAFRVQAGTTVSNLSADFLVAPLAGGDEPLRGGDYSLATASLTVVEGTNGPTVNITATPIAGSQNVDVTLTFPVVPGKNYFVESRDTLGPAGAWTALPGGPHNSGTVSETSSVSQRFYRVRVDAP